MVVIVVLVSVVGVVVGGKVEVMVMVVTVVSGM